MPRPMTHRWGKRINPAAAPPLLDEAAINKMLTPLHMAIELLPLGLFTQDHAEMIAKLNRHASPSRRGEVVERHRARA